MARDETISRAKARLQQIFDDHGIDLCRREKRDIYIILQAVYIDAYIEGWNKG
jgi:hypothetical protein